MAFEIKSFLQRTGKRQLVIPVDVDGIREQSPWLGMHDRIWLEEPDDSTEPSEEILYQIRRSLLFRRRTTVWQNLLAAIALILALVSGLALWQWRTAEDRYRTALSRQLAAQSFEHLNTQLDLALLLSLEAVRVADTVEARSALLMGLTFSSHLRRFLDYQVDSLAGLAFSPTVGS